jgi:hypothetical protein
MSGDWLDAYTDWCYAMTIIGHTASIASIGYNFIIVLDLNLLICESLYICRIATLYLILFILTYTCTPLSSCILLPLPVCLCLGVLDVAAPTQSSPCSTLRVTRAGLCRGRRTLPYGSPELYVRYPYRCGDVWFRKYMLICMLPSSIYDVLQRLYQEL